MIIKHFKFDMLHKSYILNKKGKEKKGNEYSQVLEIVTEKEGP